MLLTIYTAWTSHCDIAPYTGWVMGYSEATLKQTTVLNLTPNGSDGSVWMRGFGLAADTSGNIFLLDRVGVELCVSRGDPERSCGVRFAGTVKMKGHPRQP